MHRNVPAQISCPGTFTGASFAQATVAIPGTNGRTFADVRCYQCQSFGHYAQDCPTRTPPPSSSAMSGTTLLQHALMLAQHSHRIDPAWILLDSQSTISVFNNPAMIQNIRDSGRTLRAITNGGYQDSSQIGDFPNLGEVWFNPSSIANILSLADVCKVCRVTMDSDKTPSINVHRKDGSIMQFVEHPSGLYVYNSNVSNNSVTAYTLVSTVAKQKQMFTPRQIRDADRARSLYRHIGRPSETDFQRILRNMMKLPCHAYQCRPCPDHVWSRRRFC